MSNPPKGLDLLIPNNTSIKTDEKMEEKLTEKKAEVFVKLSQVELSSTIIFCTSSGRFKSRMEFVTAVLLLRLGSNVSIKRKSKDKGKIEIDYYSNEDLERIIFFSSAPRGI